MVSDMPIPVPRKDEDKVRFMARCMTVLTSEYPADQRYAICTSAYREAVTKASPREAAIRRRAQNGRRLIRSEAAGASSSGKLTSQSAHRIRVGLSELTRARIGEWADTEEGRDYLKAKADYRAGAMHNLSQDIKRTVRDLQDLAESREWSETRLKRELKARTQDLIQARAEVISQTEAVQDQNFSTFMDAHGQGDVWLEWQAHADARPSHQIDGERVRPGEEFSNGLKYPGEPGAPAEEVVNCRCSVRIVRGSS